MMPTRAGQKWTNYWLGMIVLFLFAASVGNTCDRYHKPLVVKLEYVTTTTVPKP